MGVCRHRCWWSPQSHSCVESPRPNPPPSIVALTRLAGRESGPAFAPDGEQVAFAWSGEKFDNTDIYVTLVGSTSVRRLTTDAADDFAPSWSPDGRRIAFLRKVGNSARIHLTSALGGPDSKLSDFPVGVIEGEGVLGAQIAWSPDGRHIVAGRDPRLSERRRRGPLSDPRRGRRAARDHASDPSRVRPRSHILGRRSPTRVCRSARQLGCSCRCCSPAGVPFGPPRWTTQVIPTDRGADRDLSAGRTLWSGMEPRRQVDRFCVGVSWPCASLARLGRRSRAAERIEIAGESAGYPATAGARDRLAFSQVAWDSHLYRFVAGLPAEQVAPSSSFETDPTSPRMAGGLRLSRGVPATLTSGWRLRTARTHASSRTTRGSGQVRLPGRRTDASVAFDSSDATVRFASGPSTPMAARRARSRPDPATQSVPTVVARRQVDLFRQRSGRDARTSGGCPRRAGSRNRSPGRAAASSAMSSATAAASCTSRLTEIPPCS